MASPTPRPPGRPRRSLVRRSAVLPIAAMALSVLPPAGIAAAEQPPVGIATDRQEQVLQVRDGVIVSQVSYALPLPAGAPAHPADCDRAGYLRYRPVGGPETSAAADQVIVQQPGAIGGAVNSDSVAANTVAAARASGRNIEFWALARRSACLDENTGFDYASRTGDYLDAVDYYFNGKPIDGRVFPGFKDSQQLAVLDLMGMERVIRDQYEIMLYEIPDQAVRQRKYVCAGISLGGLVAGFFSDWDFDGNPATTADAGYNQCAAFAAQDTMITSDPVAIQNTPFLHDLTNAIVGPANDVVKAVANVGVLPRSLVSVPMVGARAFMIYRLAGLAAHLEPEAESRLLAHLPRDLDLEITLNFMFSGSPAEFLTDGADGSGNIRDFRFTNQALLGVFIDNNSGNFSLFQQGVGALSGGPVAEKTFPTPGSVTQIPLLGGFLRVSAGSQQRVRPTDRNALYTWRNYDDVAGIPFTAPNHEASDIRDAARQLGTGAPYAYWETYFPARLFIDIGAGYGGARSGDMTNLRYHNMARTKPYYTSYAGDGFVQTGAGIVVPPPPTAQVVTLPGYSHVDTIGAARVQNDGRTDPSAQTLADFAGSLR